MLYELGLDAKRLNNKLNKSKEKLAEEFSQILIESFKPKEEEMANDIRKHWEYIYDVFMKESEYYTPYDYQLLQLEVNKWSKDFYKSCWYTLMQLGIYKPNGIKTSTYATNPSEEEILKHNEKLMEKFIVQTVELSILNSRYKLISSALKHFEGEEINSVEVIRIELDKGNLAGSFKINIAFKPHRTLVTQAIYAGGYNIQKFHIRYLSKVY